MSRFLNALRSGLALLMDGAMGTELQAAGLPHDVCCEQWNLSHPDRVRAVHQAYRDAGAQCVLTNTFQANPQALSRHGLAPELESIVVNAIAIARSVAADDQFILGSIGPDQSDFAGAVEWIQYFRGVDALLFETCSSLGGIATVKAAVDVPVLASYAFLRTPNGELRTAKGLTPEDCAREAAACGIDALGVNCGRDIGMDETIQIVRRSRQTADLCIFARPNAGTPTKEAGRWIYPASPEMMAAGLPELLATGTTMVGGCCGTTPRHIAAFRPIIKEWNAQRARTQRR
jgi:5-methyltetrahydrofolate--homocysteine methyltransferase